MQRKYLGKTMVIGFFRVGLDYRGISASRLRARAAITSPPYFTAAENNEGSTHAHMACRHNSAVPADAIRYV